MTDSEKVLQALEHCDLCSDMPNCPGCAYLREPNCMEHLKRDIIALLKAQEPRVMTLGEALRADWCFVEIRKYLRSGDLFYYDTFSGILVENSGIYVIHKRGTSAYVDVDRYGIDWRCWTSRPTEAERKATPWDVQQQREYEAAVEMTKYCERYEQTYNADDGSM